MNRQQWAIVFHKESCIQCNGCEGACKIWREVAQGVKWREVTNHWVGQYPDVSCFTVSLACQHCTSPECIEVCPVGAIYKRNSDGLVLVDGEKCVSCKACLGACPFEVPQFGADGKMQKCDLCHSKNPGEHAENYCPPCVQTCPTKALEFKKLTHEQKAADEQAMLTLLSKAGS